MKPFYLLVSFLVMGITAKAQWSNNPDTNTLVACRDVTTNTGVVDCKAVQDTSGGIYVFSQIGANSFDSVHAVLAQKIRKDGLLEWGSALHNKVLLEGRGIGFSYTIIDALPDGDNGAYILIRVDSTGSEIIQKKIILQRMGPYGQVLWGNQGVLVAEKDSQFKIDNVRMCSAGSDGVIVSWEKYKLDPVFFSYEYSQIFAQKYSANGTANWQTGGEEIGLADTVLMHNIVSDGNGGAIFYYDILDSHRNDVRVQRVGSSGTKLWGNGVPVSTGTGKRTTYVSESMYKFAIEDNTGGIMLLYNLLTDSNTAVPDIWVQRLDSAGSRLWTDSGRLVAVHQNSCFPQKVVSDGEGGAIILTTEQKMDSVKPYLYARRVSAAGNHRWPINGVPIRSFGTAAIVRDSSGNFIFPYLMSVEDQSYAVKACKVDRFGAHLWGGSNIGKLISTRSYYIYNTINAHNSSGDDIIITWVGHRFNESPNKSLAAKVKEDGSLISSRFYCTVQDGNWNDPAIWLDGLMPDNHAVVIVRHNVQVTTDASCHTLKVELPGGTVTVAPGVNLMVSH